MIAVKWPRLVAAGLVAGVFTNLSGMASAAVLGLADAFARMDVTPALGGVLLHAGLRLGIGLAAAFLYARVAHRGDGGMATALGIGVAVWLIGYVPPIALLHEIRFLDSVQAIQGGAWGLVEACVAVAVAARVYGADSGTR